MEPATDSKAPGRRARACKELSRGESSFEGTDRSLHAKRPEGKNTEVIIVTISEDTIKNAVLRYHREYDRYLKLSARVAEICRLPFRLPEKVPRSRSVCAAKSTSSCPTISAHGSQASAHSVATSLLRTIPERSARCFCISLRSATYAIRCPAHRGNSH